MERLDSLLRRVRLRLAMRLMVSCVCRASLWALILGSAWTVLARLLPQAGDPLPVLAAALGIAALLASAVAYAKRPSLVDAASATDARFALRERLLSSLRLRDLSGPMYEALRRDALDHLPDRVSDGFPVLPLHDLRRAAVAAVAAVAALLLPEIDVFGYRERVEAAVELAETRRIQAQALRESTPPLKRLEDLDPSSELHGLAREVERIAERLESGEISEKQAFAHMTQVARTLAGQTPRTSLEQPRPKPASDAADSEGAKALAKAVEQGDLARAVEQVQRLHEQLREESRKGERADPQRLEKLAEQLQEASKLLGGDATELGARLADLASRMSANDLAQLAEALTQMDLDLGELARILEQMDLASESFGRMQEALEELLGERGEWGDLAQGELRSLQMERLGQIARCEGRRGGSPGRGTGAGGAMGGAGRGAGGGVGDLPDVASGLEPTMLPGDLTAGRLLAGIKQRSEPDPPGETPTIEAAGELLIQVRQEAEQAMAREEIPPGARELVRGYFSSLESATGESGPRAAPTP